MSIGDTLAEARRQSGLTITQVSQQTRIRETIIRSIEQGDFSPCGGDFYARGHIRSIATVVGIDPEPLIREYDAEHGPPGGMRASEIFEPATPIKIREPRSFGWLGKSLAVVVLAAAGYGAYHLYESGHNNSSHPPAASADVRSTSSPKPKSTVHPVAAQTHHAPAKPEAVIRLTAVQDCWIRLTGSGGHQIYQGIIHKGSTKTWTEQKAVAMIIGNPPGIVLTINGKAEPLNTVQVVTLSVNPLSKTPVSIH